MRFAGTASTHFRYAFKWADKVAWHYCSAYPTSDMTTNRKERDQARNLVKSGIDPRANKVAAKIEAQAAIVEVISVCQHGVILIAVIAEYGCWIQYPATRFYIEAIFYQQGIGQ